LPWTVAAETAWPVTDKFNTKVALSVNVEVGPPSNGLTLM
jgi:hypothetical protein